ncbi:hypothetical protein [Clostridium baratii]|uniref:hypothetical protein n=1 Tax=Clostridium baratii TaxID=1561 RepID=UPI0030CC2CA4
MNKKELLEFIFNGLKDQFTELGSLMKIVEGETAEIAQERRATANTLFDVKKLIDELEKEEAQSKEAGCNIEAETIQGDIDIENISTSELVKVLFKKWDKEDFIKSWTKPLIEYLRAKHTSYTQIIITTEGVRVTEDIEGIPYSTEG